MAYDQFILVRDDKIVVVEQTSAKKILFFDCIHIDKSAAPIKRVADFCCYIPFFVLTIVEPASARHNSSKLDSALTYSQPSVFTFPFRYGSPRKSSITCTWRGVRMRRFSLYPTALRASRSPRVWRSSWRKRWTARLYDR